MKAAVITKPGGPEVLQLHDRLEPEPAGSEVLVRVHASALNRADTLQRRGKYPAPADSPADIPGLEFAGEVAALGDGSSRWKIGDRVFGIIGGGAHAEFVAAHEQTLCRIPDRLGWVEAAAVPEAFMTAHDAVFTQGGLLAGENLLIHAIGSGVGIAALQLACAMGAGAFGTSRTAEKIVRAKTLGLAAGLVMEEVTPALEDFAKRSTGGKGFDVVLDLVGGPYLPMSLPALAVKGRIVLLATMGGAAVEIDLRQFLSRRLHLIGSVLRARSLDEKIAVTQAFVRNVLPLLASGAVKPIIDCTYPLADIAEAHRKMESNETFGKIVLTM